MIALAESSGAYVERLESPASCEVGDAEYRRLLGYPPGADPSERALELGRQSRRWYAEHGRPWSYFREAPLRYGHGAVLIDGAPFRSPGLLERFRNAGVDRVVLAVACAGAGCEERARTLWAEGKPDEFFFLDLFGSAVVEGLVSGLNGRVCAWADGEGRRALPHYSPGYSGWDVAEQARLFDRLERGCTVALPEPLRVLPSGMLVPRKALLAVIGLTAAGPASPPGAVPCVDCSFSPCRYRRLPYRQAAAAPAPARPPAASAYRIGERALRKWAAERVTLERKPNGAVLARFRLDGTTCSNLGQPLAFDYELELGRSEAGWILRRAHCRPAPGDEGHRKMCAYLSEPEPLQRALAQEAPPTGVPLDEALAAAPPGAASGCLCTAEYRAHKWSMALQAVHFALRLSPP